MQVMIHLEAKLVGLAESLEFTRLQPAIFKVTYFSTNSIAGQST